ncbi:hypothetical protein GCM10023115_46510 [Pontixanthobacter gangjinensis]|uniref:Uncharacterized protein n=1 Tax=Christiangramia aestuarii TaxID=1028746 RepID=A0A7M3SXC6_9FLAO|nr:hypothetical protein [Christiangramia aestuarii]MUP41257.1 hypothetical protein [Christiangramia aestuarii]
MTRINRKLGFFKRNYYSIFGSLWLALGIVYYLNKNYSEEKLLTFNFVISICYVILSMLYFYKAFGKPENNKEFIEWDDNVLNYKPIRGKIHSYKINDLINLKVSNSNLIIKAPDAKGTMAELNGYSETDLQKLESRFGSF